MASGSLWRHIDLSVYACYDSLIDQAWARVAQTGELPIELHVRDYHGHCESPSRYDHTDFYRIISHISGRVETLVFNVNMHGTFRRFHSSVLKQVLLARHPTPTKLVLSSEESRGGASIWAPRYNSGWEQSSSLGFLIELTHGEIEKVFAPLTVLHLRGIFPQWSSAAYHGLVDLRLLGTHSWNSIRENEFAAILGSSPGLKVLYFGLHIDGSAVEMGEVDPIHLKDLKVVKIFSGHEWDQDKLCPSDVLWLLVPGSRPLRLSFHGYYEPGSILVTQLERLFVHSKLVKIYTYGVLPPMGIIRGATHLRRVILDGFDSKSYSQRELPPAWMQGTELGPLLGLESLYITQSSLSKADLHLLVGWCPHLTGIHHCSVRHTLDNSVKLSVNEVSDAFPTVRVVGYDNSLSSFFQAEADLAADWDPLDWVVSLLW